MRPARAREQRQSCLTEIDAGSSKGHRRGTRIKCLQALTLTSAMARTLRSQGPTNPEQSIRRRARIHSGGSGRFTPTAVRLAPPDRAGGRPSGHLEALQWQPTWALTPMLCPLALGGFRHGGTGLGPQGFTRCPTGAAPFRTGDMLSPPPQPNPTQFMHYSLSAPNRPFPHTLSSSILVSVWTSRIGPAYAYSCPLFP